MSKRKIALTTTAIILGIMLIGWIIWGIGVAVSAPKGVGDAYKQKNSSANWTAAQARFENQYQAVISADRKIALAAEAKAAKPDDLTLRQTYSGIVSGCISAVADYNAESRKYLAADFKSADLPYQIDDTDPATDCK
jgi:hypothetical protein